MQNGSHGWGITRTKTSGGGCKGSVISHTAFPIHSGRDCKRHTRKANVGSFPLNVDHLARSKLLNCSMYHGHIVMAADSSICHLQSWVTKYCVATRNTISPSRANRRCLQRLEHVGPIACATRKFKGRAKGFMSTLGIEGWTEGRRQTGLKVDRTYMTLDQTTHAMNMNTWVPWRGIVNCIVK